MKQVIKNKDIYIRAVIVIMGCGSNSGTLRRLKTQHTLGRGIIVGGLLERSNINRVGGRGRNF